MAQKVHPCLPMVQIGRRIGPLLFAATLFAGNSDAASRPKKLKVGFVHCKTQSGFVEHGRLKALCRLIDKHPKLDVLVAPEWFLVPSKELHSGRSMVRIQRTLENKTKGKDMLVIPGSIAWNSNNEYRNTTLAVSNGKVLMTYSKRSDGEDANFGARVGVPWRRGEKQGIFTWRGLEVGVEICQDHYLGKLAYDQPARLDLYVVPACAFSKMNQRMVPVSLNGAALFCNGGSSYVGGQAIKQRANATVEKFSETTFHSRTKKVPLDLSIFEISLDPPN